VILRVYIDKKTNMNEKVKKFFGFKRGLSDEFKEKIEDIIWERVELLKDLKENEMLINSTLKRLQRYCEDYKRTKKEVESNEKKLIELIESLDDELDIKSIYKDPVSYPFPSISDI